MVIAKKIDKHGNKIMLTSNKNDMYGRTSYVLFLEVFYPSGERAFLQQIGKSYFSKKRAIKQYENRGIINV